MTIGAGLTLGHLGEERLFFQLTLVNLRQCLARTENHINEQSPDKEEYNQDGGENL